MSNVSRYPDLNGLSLEKKVEALMDYTIKLSREIAYITSNIDSSNMTQAYNNEFVGKVSFTDLATEGSTEINGQNITTGVIDAVDITGVTITGTTITGGDITGTTITGGTISGTDITGVDITGTSTITGAYIYGGTVDAAEFISYAQNSDQTYNDELKIRYGDLVFSRVPLGAGSSVTVGDLLFVDEETSQYMALRAYDFPLHIYSEEDMELTTDAVMRLVSGDNMSITVGNGKTLYIGSSTTLTQHVSIGANTTTIGGTGKTINLNGTVYVNGTEIS